MIENDPDFKWSNAWWGKWLLGIVAPAALVLGSAAAFVTGKAYGLGSSGTGRGIRFWPLEGPAAQAMAVAYVGFALAAFAYGYARHHRALNAYADALLAAGLLTALAGMAWSAWVRWPV